MENQPQDGNASQSPSRVRGWFEERVSEDARKIVAQWGRRLMLAGVIGWLLYQLAQIGWANIVRDIPGQPLFYLIFVGMYLVQPFAETLIYKIIWRIPWKEIFPVILKKRVFNKEVINYSGEANLFMWARQRLDRRSKWIFRDIKDNTILSSLNSMFIAAALLGTFLILGVLPIEVLTSRIETGWLLIGGFCLLMLILLGIRYRRSVISLPGDVIKKVLGLHVARSLLVQSLQILQWIVVMPDVPMTVWFSLLAAQIIAQQIPLVPSKDLLVVAMSAELAGWLEVSESGIASMLLVTAVLDKVVNFVLFSYLSMRETRTKKSDVSSRKDFNGKGRPPDRENALPANDVANDA